MADQAEQEEIDERVIVVDGVEIDDAKLTFREQRDIRNAIRELTDDPSAEVGDAGFVDYLPAVAFVVRKRNNPEYTLEEALDCSADDFLVPRSKLPKRRRPTQPKTD